MLISVSKVLLLLWIVLINFVWFDFREVFNSKLVILIIVFIGVLILWFIVVRNLFLVLVVVSVLFLVFVKLVVLVVVFWCFNFLFIYCVISFNNFLFIVLKGCLRGLGF